MTTFVGGKIVVIKTGKLGINHFYVGTSHKLQIYITVAMDNESEILVPCLAYFEIYLSVASGIRQPLQHRPMDTPLMTCA